MSGISADVMLAMPEMALLTAVLAVLLIGLFTGRNSEAITCWLSVAALIGVFAIVYFMPSRSVSFAFGGMYIDDKLADAIKLFACIAVAVVFLYARSYLVLHTEVRTEFYILGLLATLGVLVMASAHNLVLIYLGLELLSLSLYALVAYVRISENSTEAAMKYFVLGAIASGILLYGMSILYGLSGTLDLAKLNLYILSSQGDQASVNIPLIFALTFIVVGVAFKLGAVPFHMWVPDVYHGASTVVTLFIATAPKLAAFVMMMRLLSDGLQEIFNDWQGMLMILAALSLIFGNIIAIAQTSIKRLLAYSAISHVGFVLLGMLSGDGFGYAAAFFYTATYVLMATGVFGTLLLLSNQDKDVDLLVDLKGLSRTHPWFAFIMLLFMLSMAGVPLTVGFYAKLYVLQSLINGGMLWLAVLAIVMTVIGAFYYLRVVKFMYFDKASEKLRVQGSILTRSILSANGLLVVILFIFPNALLNYCIQALN